jgi:hypothetical protein
MVYSLGAVFVVMAIILGVTWRSHSQVVQPVDYSGAVEQAVSAKVFPVLVPSPLPKGYVATSARFEPETYGASGDVRWYLGFTTGSNEFVSLWQSTARQGRIVAAASNHGDCSQEQTIDGATWTKCENPKPLARVLARTQDGVTTVIAGTASFDELVAFSRSLTVAH